MNIDESNKRALEIKKELMEGLDYRRLGNSQLPINDISRLVFEILEVGCISKELQIKIGEVLGERWLKRRYIFE